MNKVKINIKNPYFLITVTYLFTHVFLLLLSGCWWDDWTFMTHDLVYINEVASQSGRPEWNILIPLCWSLANNGRILIFFLYFFNSIFVYNILVDSTLFDIRNSLFITLLFTVLPVNESRLLISNFPYSVGLFFFFLAFMLFIKWNNTKSKKIVFRIGLLILFLMSFILNSLLAYYYIIFIYLFISDVRKKHGGTLLKKCLISIKNVVLGYFDFFILPFVFFIINKLLFPVTDTNFEGRSSITLNGLLKCFKYLPLSIISIFKDIYSNILNCLTYWPVIIVCIVIAILLFVFIKKSNKKVNFKKAVVYCIFGLIVLSLGLFAYVEIRGNVINTNGVQGRDSILSPLGIAIIITYIYSLFNNKYKTVFCSLTIVLCALSFNLLYIEWQKDYYYQLSMENLLDNEIIENNDTFFLANLSETNVQGERYYSLNINANHVFKDETRFFIPKISNLYMLKSKNEIESAKKILNGSQMMKDYNPDDYCLDAVLIYENNLSWKDVLVLKYYEIKDRDKFEKLVKSSGSMKIVEVNNEFTTKLLEKYDKNKLNGDLDVVDLLNVYYN